MFIKYIKSEVDFCGKLLYNANIKTCRTIVRCSWTGEGENLAVKNSRIIATDKTITKQNLYQED